MNIKITSQFKFITNIIKYKGKRQRVEKHGWWGLCTVVLAFEEMEKLFNK